MIPSHLLKLIEGSSPDMRQNLGIMNPDYYFYLNQSDTYKVDGTDDKNDFCEMMVNIYEFYLNDNLNDQLME